MDSSETIPRDGAEPADACEMGRRLSAYYDGELDASFARQVEQHLRACDECRAALQDLRELSALADGVGAEGISQAVVRQIHRAVDADENFTLLRVATALTGLAASALVVGSVWLSEMPASTSTPPRLVITESDAPWTRVAVDLRVDPLPQNGWEVRDQQMLADARLADWMLSGLSRRAR